MKLPRLLALQLCTYRAPQQDMLAHDGKTRKSGQALLLAVLLMLFAALLGATFVTVVAFNLSQTARNESKKSAEAAAQAGVRMANDRLVNSAEGENWNPELISPPPAAGTPEFNTYYTPFEKAQGWADRRLVKFPDPRLLTAGSKDTPTYLLKVGRVVDPANAANTNYPNYGMLKVEVIGRSDDNDAAFYRQVVYKGTSIGGGPLSYPLYVANYDTQKKTLRVTTMTGAVATYNSAALGNVSRLPVKDASLFFPGQTIIIAKSNTPVTPREWAVVYQIIGSDLILNRALTTPGNFGANSEVRAAGVLMNNLLQQSVAGANAAVALDGDGNRNLAPATPYTTQVIDPVDSTNGLYFGAGLLLDGKSRVDLGADDVVTVSGPVHKARTAAIAKINDDETGPTTTDFPESTVTNRSTGVGAKVVDGPNSEDGVPVLVPPSLAGTDGKYTRYLSLTRDADRNAGSQYGYGPGVYIDNADDVEKVQVQRTMGTPATTVTTYRTLDNWEMHRLWTRKSFPERTNESGNVDNGATNGTGAAAGYTAAPGLNPTDDYHRLAWERTGNVDNYQFPMDSGSLEQRGVRGWISPWEYLPRGTQVELNGNDIVITRDDLSDTVALPQDLAVDNAKSWSDASGVNQFRNYRMRLRINNPGAANESVSRYIGPENNDVLVNTYNQPFNGVIFAEGNVRVRGSAGAKDLTIVSKGNIYIEGNLLEPGTGKIALLAKRNVVVNPTQFVARPAGMQVIADLNDPDEAISPLPDAVATTTDGASQTFIDVPDGRLYRVGDRIQVGRAAAESLSAWLTVTSIDTSVATLAAPNRTRLTLNTSHGAGNNQPVSVTRLADLPVQETGGQYVRVMRNSNLPFVREVIDDGTSPVGDNFTWKHGAQNVTAFTLTNTTNIIYPPSTTANPRSMDFVVKPDDTSDNSISGALAGNEKLLRLIDTVTGTRQHSLLDIQDTPPTEVRDGDDVETVQALSTRTNGGTPTEVNPEWEISGTGIESYLPARRAAAIDLRTVPAGQPSSVPLTVSVGLSIQPDLAWGPFIRQYGSGWGYDELGSGVADEPENRNYVHESFYTGALRRETEDMGATAAGYITFRHDPGYLNSNWLTYRDNLPSYYIAEPKIEGAGMINPGINIEVEATILAEEGSWFIIPAPMNRPETGASAAADSTRYRRYNYSISVEGTIAQNFTPTGVEDLDNEVAPDADELNVQSDAIPTNDAYIGRGAMAQWIDANARPTDISSGAGDDWLSVTYKPSPLGATEGGGLKLPVSPDWSYVG